MSSLCFCCRYRCPCHGPRRGPHHYNNLHSPSSFVIIILNLLLFICESHLIVLSVVRPYCRTRRAVLLGVVWHRAVLFLSAARLAVPLYAARRSRILVRICHCTRHRARLCTYRCLLPSSTSVSSAAPHLFLASARPGHTIVSGTAPWYAAPRPSVYQLK